MTMMESDDPNSDLVAVWEVHLADGIHSIEFEHGTTSGKRILRLNSKVHILNAFLCARKVLGITRFKSV